MRSVFGFCVLAAIVAVPIGAQSAAGMGAMQYYVGTWTCSGGPIGQKPVNATVTYTLDDNVMRQWVTIAPQGRMTKPYVLNSTTTWDAKNRRYAQAGLDSDAEWWISYAKPFSGHVEEWTEHSKSSGKLGKSTTTRTSDAAFTFASYPSTSAAKPDFRVSCHRS